MIVPSGELARADGTEFGLHASAASPANTIGGESRTGLAAVLLFRVVRVAQPYRSTCAPEPGAAAHALQA